MTIPVKDYSESYKLLMLEQFKAPENLNKIFKLKGLFRNEVEALFFSIIESFYLDSAVGSQLDILGKIVGLGREGRGDDKYRTLIKLKIRINASSGQPWVLIQTVRELYAATFVHYKQVPGESGNVNILQDGTINLFDEFNGITEAGENLLWDAFGDWYLTDESGDHLVTEELDSIIAFDTGYGDQSIFTQSDNIDESILYDILPSGVGLILLTWAMTEESEYFLTEENESLLF